MEWRLIPNKIFTKMGSVVVYHRTFLRAVLASLLIFASYATAFGQDERQDAIVTLSFLEEEDSKTIQAKATDQGGVPIEDLEVYFYVQRTFSLLPIGGFFNITDENGIVEVTFPDDLPGDTEGYVTIVLKVMDSDLYNDLTIERVKNWGVPTKTDQFEEKRTLWSAGANAPITLVIGTLGMILAVWYIIGHNIVTLIKISKVKDENS